MEATSPSCQAPSRVKETRSFHLLMLVDYIRDAFSSGQISSKIWLCEELEKLFDRIDHMDLRRLVRTSGIFTKI